MAVPPPRSPALAAIEPLHDDECRSLLAMGATADDAAALALTRRALLLCERPLLASEVRADWADRARGFSSPSAGE